MTYAQLKKDATAHLAGLPTKVICKMWETLHGMMWERTEAIPEILALLGLLENELESRQPNAFRILTGTLDYDVEAYSKPSIYFI